MTATATIRTALHANIGDFVADTTCADLFLEATRPDGDLPDMVRTYLRLTDTNHVGEVFYEDIRPANFRTDVDFHYFDVIDDAELERELLTLASEYTNR